ncbi:AlbA family DNA-binding domain-containing protein [Treponema sp. OMZ 840]|uniref:AlbA family DNA-binding domain-containing protein n=1 Tax=Treponema sp. OMZ 840 TaxID=244313 RepID=UPI003D915B56
MQNLNLLIKELISLPTETEWLELKHNNFDPQMIGSDISALANSAAYRGKNKAYMIWGINNENHDIVGTNYNRFSKRVHGQEIESWLKNAVSKNADFDFF